MMYGVDSQEVVMTHRLAYPHIAVIATATVLTTSLAGLNAQQRAGEAVSIGDNDIGGVVRSTKGAEAGVWVIAETNNLPTKFAKIVVTDDDGRYVVPQLPRANYKIWVRGYGLIDSQPIQATPSKTVNLTAEVAPNPRGGGILSGGLLVFAAAGARQGRVPWHRPQGQRHSREHEAPRTVVALAQDR
jgi:hypothetical protein